MFKVINEEGSARQGKLKTSHGIIESPFFMPVLTKGAAKHVSQEELIEMNTKAVIANAFLLYLKPGLEVIKKAGGLHEFMHWKKVIFTDSGGFQVIKPQFILSIKDEGVTFRNPFDKSKEFLSPEKSIQIQNALGSDVAMCLDDVPLHDAGRERVAESLERTMKWAERCLKAHKNEKQLLFGIAQGGHYKDLRKKALEHLLALDFDGIALGGLSIGESKKQLHETIRHSMKIIGNSQKPVYLMGVGSPIELLEAVSQGIDVFDSAFPTRVGRHGQLFTSNGLIDLTKTKYAKDFSAIDEACKCFACRHSSKALMHHLIKVREPNAERYASYHNLYFIQNLMKETRKAIKKNYFKEFRKEFLKKYPKKTKS